MTPVAELLRLPITFRAADGSSVHSPLAGATIGGVETLLVLDTGSDVHLLTRELADRARLTVKGGEQGTDHAGAVMPSWSAGDVTMLARRLELVLHDVVVIAAPTPFPGWGIGGILSPQHLHPGGRVVIDLVRDELILAEGATDASLTAWLAERSPALTTLSLERDGKSLTPVISAAVEPFPETAAMLNTGGRNTEFDETVVPGLVGSASERLGGGVSGADVVGSLAGNQVLVVDGLEIPVASLAIREQMGYPSGLIGMNVLRGTVLACDADPAGRVIWQIPRAN